VVTEALLPEEISTNITVNFENRESSIGKHDYFSGYTKKIIN
jgi:hypothetical protein